MKWLKVLGGWFRGVNHGWFTLGVNGNGLKTSIVFKTIGIHT